MSDKKVNTTRMIVNDHMPARLIKTPPTPPQSKPQAPASNTGGEGKK